MNYEHCAWIVDDDDAVAALHMYGECWMITKIIYIFGGEEILLYNILQPRVNIQWGTSERRQVLVYM